MSRTGTENWPGREEATVAMPGPQGSWGSCPAPALAAIELHSYDGSHGSHLYCGHGHGFWHVGNHG